MTRILTRVEYGEKPAKDSEFMQRLMTVYGYSAEYAFTLANVWHEICRACIDSEIGSNAKLISHGWFKDANRSKIAELLKTFKSVHVEEIQSEPLKYKYVCMYYNEDNVLKSYCNRDDIDEGDAFIEITYELDGQIGKIVMDRGGGRVLELEREING